MDTILETYLNNIKASKSVSTYKSYANAFEKWFPKGKCIFTLEHIRRRLSNMRCSVNTKALRCVVLRRFLNFANNYKKIKDLPVILELLSSISTKETVPVVVSNEQYKHILSNCDDVKYQIAIRLMYENALRESEVLGILTNNYDSKKKTITIVDTKNGNDYLIYLTDDLNNTIKEYYNKDSEYLLPSKRGTKIDAGNFRKYIKELCTKCGYPKLHCHSFRHGSATYLLDNDVNIFVIKEHLHHKSLQSTQKYLHISKKHKEQVRNIFSNI